MPVSGGLIGPVLAFRSKTEEGGDYSALAALSRIAPMALA